MLTGRHTFYKELKEARAHISQLVPENEGRRQSVVELTETLDTIGGKNQSRVDELQATIKRKNLELAETQVLYWI